MRLSQITIYPLKSCAPLALDVTEVLPEGLAFDRRWLIVQADDGKFLTARNVPKLLTLNAEPAGTDLRLHSNDLKLGNALRIAPAQGAFGQRSVQIWKDLVTADRCDPSASTALSEWLGQAVELVQLRSESPRPVDAKYATAADQFVSFADGFPLLLISQASLDGLNAKIEQAGHAPVPMRRFRPNLVVDGDFLPHDEDQWRHFKIGAVEFAVVKPCVRCVLTTLDVTRLDLDGGKDPHGEPLTTLKEYRRTPKGITFGMNVIPLNTGRLTLGESVKVLQRH